MRVPCPAARITTAIDLDALDSKVQEVIRQGFTSLLHVIMTAASNLLKNLENAMSAEGEAYAVTRMPETSVVEMFLSRHSDPEMRLNALLFSDPFHVALGLRPASGGLICLSASGLVARSHPPLARLMGNATHILTARGSPVLKDAYGAEWDALHLEVVEETKTYSLWKIPEGRVNR